MCVVVESLHLLCLLAFCDTAITCNGTLAAPANGHTVSGCSGSDSFQSTCTLACNVGYYNSSGQTVLTCDLAAAGPYASNLVCSGTPGHCACACGGCYWTLQSYVLLCTVAVTCNATGLIPTHARIVSGCTSTDPYNGTCIVGCVEGYFLASGSATRVCSRSTPGPYGASDANCTRKLPTSRHMTSHISPHLTSYRSRPYSICLFMLLTSE